MEAAFTSILIWVATGLFLWYIISALWHYSLFYRLGIPGPRPFPVLGTFGYMMRQGFRDFQISNYERYRGNKVYGIFDGAQPMLVLRDLDMIKDVCVKHFSSFVNRRSFALQPPADHMLNMLKDDHWKNVRSVVSPTFSSGRVRRMYPHVAFSTTNLVKRLKESAESGEMVELKDTISRFSMDVIAGAGFGVQINSHENTENNLANAIKDMMNHSGVIAFVTFLCPWLVSVFNFLGINLYATKSRKIFVSFVDAALENRKEEKAGGLPKRNDFLQLMLEAQDDGSDFMNDNLSKEEEKALSTGTTRKPLTHLDYQGQALIFVLGAYDTLSSVISFTLFLLSLNPECLRRVQEEIDEKIRGKAIPSMEEASYAIHHDPELWHDPDIFDPERFTPENKANRHPVAHMSFGHGPRNCVGMRLAQLEVKVALAGILRHLTPVPCEKTVYPVKLEKLQLRALDGLWVKMEARK
ncbi:cytochrome p450 [Plakobranchus ocellatus]|uniref:Cytochrome p450 n=1 Tax=Plakobranchus ocellatus TaxID=259542 RepID=A0AAV3YGV0_9GAST|nr:cytochrome p450 [Plakobranchus ocellatus]